jgi:hypothetical protein
LLLALALVLVLASAMVFSFSTLLGGTRLEEGAGQVESLIRFARAHAANTGRKVQIVFDAEAGSIRVMWEPDPLGDPGTYEEIADTAWQTDAINGLIEVQAVQLLGPAGEAMGESATGGSGQATDAAGPTPFIPITFYPDGSSDSAEIMLISRAPDEEQQMSVRLDGLSGAIRHELVRDAAAGEELEPANAQQTQKDRKN